MSDIQKLDEIYDFIRKLELYKFNNFGYWSDDEDDFLYAVRAKVHIMKDINKLKRHLKKIN